MAKLKAPEKFFSRLLGIAEHVAMEQQRAEGVRRQRELVRTSSQKVSPPELSEDCGLEAAVAALAESCRQVIRRRYYGQLPCARIADQLDTPRGTVTETLSRTCGLLREAMQRPREATLKTT